MFQVTTEKLLYLKIHIYYFLCLKKRKLCKAFNIDISKGYFPFNLSNIFYTGVFPKIEYWLGVDLDLYKNLKESLTLNT
jgi:hypothetical protein